MSENPMKVITIGKVVVNIGVGQSGQPLSNAMQILEQVTGQTPNQRAAKRSIRPWGIRQGEPWHARLLYVARQQMSSSRRHSLLSGIV